MCGYSNKSLRSVLVSSPFTQFQFFFVSRGMMQIPPASSPHTSKWDMTEEEVMRPCSGMKKEEEAGEDRTITLLTHRTELIQLGGLCDVTHTL